MNNRDLDARLIRGRAGEGDSSALLALHLDMKFTLALVSILFLSLAACGPAQPARTPTAAALAATSTLAPAEPRAPTNTPVPTEAGTATTVPTDTPTSTATPLPINPLQIEYLRERTFPGSDIKIEQTLAPGANYNRYIASYESDGNKIYALLTIPAGKRPASGWPVIIFNHGFIPPAQYTTTGRYVAYVDAIARAGYIVFKSDYRGHGNSEGQATGGYGSPDYTIDVLNAVASVKKLANADPNRIGMWGHSMGGQVTLRAMVVSKDIKAGVIWSGVVGSYTNLMYNWHRNVTGTPTPMSESGFPYTSPSRRWRQQLIDTYGSPDQNPTFWASISPNSYLADLGGPLQLHSSINDGEVPLRFSEELYSELKAAGQTAELYTYPGNDHNLTNSFNVAMQRSIAFFDKYVSQKTGQ